ncbi:MAG: hypothetical protein A6F71_05825 [Cycloclasticus sp. symbiont of Poecilosclerida sp. M]|nr:MAG: hypothetical protein A6F71_05825 [Cycloclasticus sp. symbiont of Poecilosclerida sp. M]
MLADEDTKLLVPLKNSYYGEGTGMILLDDVSCAGNENSLLQCSRRLSSPLFSTNCDHSEDAGVKCEGIIEKPTQMEQLQPSFSNLLTCF